MFQFGCQLPRRGLVLLSREKFIKLLLYQQKENLLTHFMYTNVHIKYNAH